MEKKFNVNIGSSISQFEQALKRFQVKKIIYKSVFRGKGLEFDSYRDFSLDEDASMIDWKASLRSNKLMARTYVEERDIDFYFVVDVSDNMLFGSKRKLKAEYAIELASSLAHVISNSGDSVGLIMFSDNIVKFLRPSKSKNQFALFAKFLSDSSLYGGKSNLREVIDELLEREVNSSSVLVFISDFIGVNTGVERELRLISSKFETMSLMVRDPLDNEFPMTDTQLILEDPRTGRQMVVDTSVISEQYKEIVSEQKRKTKNLFKNNGIDLLELNTSQNFVMPVVSFLKSRSGGIRRV